MAVAPKKELFPATPFTPISKGKMGLDAAAGGATLTAAAQQANLTAAAQQGLTAAHLQPAVPKIQPVNPMASTDSAAMRTNNTQAEQQVNAAGAMQPMSMAAPKPLPPQPLPGGPPGMSLPPGPGPLPGPPGPGVPPPAPGPPAVPPVGPPFSGPPTPPPGMPTPTVGPPPTMPNMGIPGVGPPTAPGNQLAGPGFPSLFDQPITAQANMRDANQTVAGQLQTLLDKNNPLMVKAKDEAQRMAASRGLQNSSIATQAGEQALFSSALPVAQQDAATAAQMEMADTSAKNAFGMSQLQFGQNMELAKQAFGFNKSLSSQDAYQQLQKLAAEGDQKAKLAILDYGFQTDLTVLQGQIANDRANNDFANKLVELAKTGDIQSKLQLEKFGFDTALSTQENIAKLEQLVKQGDVNAKLQLQQFNFQSLLNDQQNNFALGLEDVRFQNGQNMLMLDFEQRGVLSKQEARQQTAYLNQQHQNTLDQIAAQAAAAGTGDAAAAGRALQNNYLIAVADRQRAGSDEIARIYQTEGLKPDQQNAAVKNAYARMQQDLLVLRSYYQSSPMWDPGFGGNPAPGTPAAPGPNPPGGTTMPPGYPGGQSPGAVFDHVRDAYMHP